MSSREIVNMPIEVDPSDTFHVCSICGAYVHDSYEEIHKAGHEIEGEVLLAINERLNRIEGKRG